MSATGSDHASATSAIRKPLPGGGAWQWPSRSMGFTLLEMLLVIMLLGLIVSVTAVSVHHGLSGARTDAAAGELASALRHARVQAIASGHATSLQVDPVSDSYRTDGAAPVRLPEGLELSVSYAVQASPGKAGVIRFFPDGSATGGRITLQQGRRQWHVNVSWLTGAVAVVEL